MHDPVCVLEPGCVLRRLVIKAGDAFFEPLGRVTIADVIARNAAKRSGGVYNLQMKRHSPPAADSPAIDIHGAERKDVTVQPSSPPC